MSLAANILSSTMFDAPRIEVVFQGSVGGDGNSARSVPLPSDVQENDVVFAIGGTSSSTYSGTAITVESSSGAADEGTVARMGLISAEIKCREWLEQLMGGGGSSEKPKSAYLAEAQQKFPGLSQRSFGTAWKQAISNTGNSQWSKPGRKS